MLPKPETNGRTCVVAGCSLHLLLVKNMATAMTGLFCWLNNQQFEAPEIRQTFRPHPQCS